jgi:hypothetical protein
MFFCARFDQRAPPGEQLRSTRAPSCGTRVCLFRRGNKNEFRFDVGDQTKVPITMKKGHAAKNSVGCYQAVICRPWSDSRPSTPRVQVRRTSRSLAGVWRDYHRQFAKHPIPTVEPIRAICTLKNFLQDGRSKPDGRSVLESFGKQLDFDQMVTA